MASVTVADVRDVLGVSEADVADTKISKMIIRAATIVGLEIGRDVDAEDCTEEEKEAVTLLAAIYLFCYLTGGSAAGLNFSVGDQNVSALNNSPPLAVLQSMFERVLACIKEPSLRMV
ncbi:MAG: hypothetical protein QXJ02_04305 [Candidatus Bathyarchaeia archaeon]